MNELATQSRIARELARARRATEELLDPLSDDELQQQVSPLQSPLVWDYAHIAYFEELWLLRRVGGRGPISARHDDLYDAFQHGRDERASLPLLDPTAARAYSADVRARTLEVLDQVDLGNGDPLLRDGFVYGMVVQHELQHQETLLQTLQLRDEPYPLPVRADTPPAPDGPDEVTVAGGRPTIGTSDEPWAYDNERQAHELELPEFRIDRLPVTNARFLAFVEDRGYEDERLWDERGWEWRLAGDITLPLGWSRTEDGIVRRRFGHLEALPPDEPVQHVSFFEAAAFARWAGRRLPTEQEWEHAARWSGDDGDRRANLGQASFGPLPATASGAADCGALQLAGDVWEWTSSAFLPYPGFEAFPYAEYSEVFFGDAFRVLRGGSWASDPLVARRTFRNWDYPQRRQIFAGFRCARDA
jgi:iron(II)-dependent oxidoreductase